MNNPDTAGHPLPPKLTTAQFSALGVGAPHTIRVNHSLHGHHLGIKPVKLPNGRLLWPTDEVMALLNGEPK